MDDLISIIIPVYNVEKYVYDCLISVQKQTYQNIEVIVINDGSCDNSFIECLKIKDKRFNIINKKNEGVGPARNIGINISHGKYLTFVDSDDLISPYYIETLYKGIAQNENVKISICSYLQFKNNLEIEQMHGNYKSSIISNSLALKKLFYFDGFDTSPWGKLYLRELFDNIKFPNGIISEDLDTIYKTFVFSPKVYITDNKLYFYRIRENSAMHIPFNEKKLFSLQVAKNLLCYEFKDKEINTARDFRVFILVFNLLQEMDSKKFKSEYKESLKICKACAVKTLKSKAKIKYKLYAILTILLGKRGICLIKKLKNFNR